MTWWHGGGGLGADDKIPSFYWNSSQAHDFKHISRFISNLNIERTDELTKYSSATWGTLFCRRSILLTFYAYKGGEVAERWHDDKGEGGVSIPPKSDDVIYERPLTGSCLICRSFISQKWAASLLTSRRTCHISDKVVWYENDYGSSVNVRYSNNVMIKLFVKVKVQLVKYDQSPGKS